MEAKLPESTTWRRGKIGYEPPQQLWMQQSAAIEMIHESRKKLVDKNILNGDVLKTTTQHKAAHDADNFDWRYISAASIL